MHRHPDAAASAAGRTVWRCICVPVAGKNVFEAAAVFSCTFIMSSNSGQSSAPPALAPSGAAAAELQPQSNVSFDPVDDADVPVHTGEALQPMERAIQVGLGVRSPSPLAPLALHPVGQQQPQSVVRVRRFQH